MEYHGREYEVGDVVWTVDPFKLGSDVCRMFAIVSTRTHPFEGEQFLGATVTTTDHMLAHPLKDEDWIHGGTPEDSYLLPLSLHTPRSSNVQAPPEYDEITDPWQGRLTDDLVEKVTEEIVWTLRKE